MDKMAGSNVSKVPLCTHVLSSDGSSDGIDNVDLGGFYNGVHDHIIISSLSITVTCTYSVT